MKYIKTYEEIDINELNPFKNMMDDRKEKKRLKAEKLSQEKNIKNGKEAIQKYIKAYKNPNVESIEIKEGDNYYNQLLLKINCTNKFLDEISNEINSEVLIGNERKSVQYIDIELSIMLSKDTSISNDFIGFDTTHYEVSSLHFTGSDSISKDYTRIELAGRPRDFNSGYIMLKDLDSLISGIFDREKKYGIFKCLSARLIGTNQQHKQKDKEKELISKEDLINDVFIDIIDISESYTIVKGTNKINCNFNIKELQVNKEEFTKSSYTKHEHISHTFDMAKFTLTDKNVEVLRLLGEANGRLKDIEKDIKVDVVMKDGLLNLSIYVGRSD